MPIEIMKYALEYAIVHFDYKSIFSNFQIEIWMNSIFDHLIDLFVWIIPDTIFFNGM